MRSDRSEEADEEDEEGEGTTAAWIAAAVIIVEKRRRIFCFFFQKEFLFWIIFFPVSLETIRNGQFFKEYWHQIPQSRFFFFSSLNQRRQNIHNKFLKLIGNTHTHKGNR